MLGQAKPDASPYLKLQHDSLHVTGAVQLLSGRAIARSQSDGQLISIFSLLQGLCRR